MGLMKRPAMPARKSKCWTAMSGSAGAGGDDVVWRIDAQTTAGDLQAVQQGDVEGIELDLALEPRAEGFDDAAFEDGAGMTQHNLSDDDEHDQASRREMPSHFHNFRFAAKDSPRQGPSVLSV